MTALMLWIGFVIYASGLEASEPLSKLVVAVTPTGSPEQLSSQSQEIEKLLSQALGIKVEVMFPTNYAGVIEALRFGHAHVAFMGAWPALIAQDQDVAQVILKEIRKVSIDEHLTHESFYYSYWVVLPESHIQSMADLKNAKVAFSSQLSTSGYIAPLSRLVELGLIEKKSTGADAKDYFKEVHFAGGYPQAYEALKAKQVDVSIIAGDVPETLFNEVMANTRIIEKQGPIPSHVVVVANNLDASWKEKISQAFLTFNQPDYQPLMRKFVSGIFVRFEPSNQEHLSTLKKMIELTGIPFTEKK